MIFGSFITRAEMDEFHAKIATRQKKTHQQMQITKFANYGGKHNIRIKFEAQTSSDFQV